ncbi:uncharacterized protein EV420DRAFT_1524056 [Desarmillaria tabescens]|uniref:F-box domain-containing protein n=1 Tax=Armillaria tabescens TaxID=1929756 RepID=A0AA39TKJ2_ARMTA|nr:uncharacterized protein EV420DRAFT_1524056 [Desarmillaria tabescens]KAK0462342.1 hypothetical protein EV420DRAFT_1524056 [Desarmillaria tabescens]
MYFFCGDAPTPLKKFLFRLTLPSLASLKVDSMSFEETDTFTSVRELITRSQCPITILHFDNGDILEEDILHVFRTRPTLEDVRLTHVEGFLNQTLSELTPKLDSREILVPRLRTLHLGGNIVFDMEVFVNMVEGRWDLPPQPLHFKSLQRLKEVHICQLISINVQNSDGPITTTALSALDAYAAEGLNITFKTEYTLTTGDI